MDKVKIKEYEYMRLLHVLITVKVTETQNTTIISFGDSTKPFSYYAEVRSDDLTLSSFGARVNVLNYSYTMSLGLDNAGFSASYRDGNVVHSIGTRASIADFKAGIEYSQTTIVSDVSSITTTHNVSINGYGAAALYGIMVFGPLVPVYAIPLLA